MGEVEVESQTKWVVRVSSDLLAGWLTHEPDASHLALQNFKSSCTAHMSFGDWSSH